MLNLLPEYPKILHYYLKTSFIQINLMLQTFRSPCAEPKALSLIFIYIETASSCGRNMRLASLPRTQSDIMTQSSGICMIIVTCVSTASEEYSAIPRDASWLAHHRRESESAALSEIHMLHTHNFLSYFASKTKSHASSFVKYNKIHRM